MGRNRINDFEPKRALRIYQRRKRTKELKSHENSYQAKPAEGENRGKHIRTENTER